MTPTEAAQLAATPAEAAANAALNLGAAGAVAGQEGVVMHARRLSGGGAMKMVSNLKAIEEEGDKPVHVIQTDSAVTEVYGHGLTIIRATDSVKKVRVACLSRLRNQVIACSSCGCPLASSRSPYACSWQTQVYQPRATALCMAMVLQGTVRELTAYLLCCRCIRHRQA
jgi:hypothetical protein